MTQFLYGSAPELCESSSDPRSLAGRPDETSELLGQVLTPEAIARRMVLELFADRPAQPVSILDPCTGPATFPNQMIRLGVASPGDHMTLVDVDSQMISRSKAWVTEVNAAVDLVHADYLEIEMDNQFDFAVLNPPFIRQEWIEKKVSYRTLFKMRYGLEVPGTSNLYAYFIAKVLRDLKPGGRFACIIYDSWKFTKYGHWLRDLLAKECVSTRVVSVDRLPFNDRLIDATRIFGIKADPMSANQDSLGTSHGLFNHNRGLSDIDGFNPLEEVYMTKRGLRLKQVDFFMTDLKGGGPPNATPFLKKVRLVKDYAVSEDHPEAALLVSPKSNSNSAVIAELQRRLSIAMTQPHRNVSILTWHRERPHSWMYHRSAPYAPIVFNYYIRNRPRHIFNPDRAYSDNFYGLISRGDISPVASLAALNSTAVCLDVITRARNQGNGLAKIQLFEYRQVLVPNLLKCSKNDLTKLHDLGAELIERPQLASYTLVRIDEMIAALFADSRLRPSSLKRLFSEIRKEDKRKKGA